MYLISSIEVASESSPDGRLTISNSSVVVFIGPNNSGKSMALREIQACLAAEPGSRATKIVQKIELTELGESSKKHLAVRLLTENNLPTEGPDDESVQVNSSGVSMSMQRGHIRSILESKNPRSPHFVNLFIARQLLRLDGVNRLQLVNRQQVSSYWKPSSSFGRLFANDSLRKSLRKVLFEAF